MKQIALLVILLINCCAVRNESPDLIILTPNQSDLQSEDASSAHLVDVGTLDAELLSALAQARMVELEERSLVGLVSAVNVDTSIHELVDRLWKLIFSSLDECINTNEERCALLIVERIVIDTHFHQRIH